MCNNLRINVYRTIIVPISYVSVSLYFISQKCRHMNSTHKYIHCTYKAEHTEE
jgi:hypothetical protein